MPSVLAQSTQNSDKPHTILILKSKNSAYYNKTIHSLRGYFNKNTTFIVRNINNQHSLNSTAHVIIAFGLKASLFSRENFPNTPTIFAFLTQQQSDKLLPKSNETHLLIEQSNTRYFAFARALFPEKSIGVLTEDNNLIQLNEQLKDFQIIDIKQQNDIQAATRSLIKFNDIFLAIPNKQIFNRQTLKGILLSTYQNETPLISYSPSHVKAGAIAAIYSSTRNLSQHIAEEAKLKLDNKSSISKQQFSKYFSIEINRKVAQSLRIQLPSNETIIKTLSSEE